MTRKKQEVAGVGFNQIPASAELVARTMLEVLALDRQRVGRVLWQKFRHRVRIDGGSFWFRLFVQLLTVREPIGVWTAEAILAGLRCVPNRGRGTAEGQMIGAVQCANLLALGRDEFARHQLMALVEGACYLDADMEGREEADVPVCRWLGYLQRVRCQDYQRWHDEEFGTQREEPS